MLTGMEIDIGSYFLGVWTVFTVFGIAWFVGMIITNYEERNEKKKMKMRMWMEKELEKEGSK